MSDILRITGMSSGIDTEGIVQKLIKVEQIKVDRAKQEKQYLEWQKEDYREVANSLRGFQDEFFDVLNPTSNLMSESTFSLFTGSAEIAGITSSDVTVETTANSVAGDITINSITQLATKDTYNSGSEVLGNITSGAMSTIASINTQVDIDNTMSFTFDGVTKTISLDQTDYVDYNAFATDLSNKLQDAFTNVDITAEVIGGNQLEFKVYQSGTTTEEPGHPLFVNANNADLLNLVSLAEGQSNTVNTSKSLAEVFGRSGDSSLTINGESFTFADTTLVSEVMNQINSSVANVTLSYDNFSDKFSLISNKEGSNGVIAIADTDGLFGDLKLQGGSETYSAAQNAVFEANGVTTSRSSNSFEINGTSITLNNVTASEINININSDTSDVKDMITKFVMSYNTMISKINESVSSVNDNDFPPLTAEQKEGMTDEDIETWQEKARAGTLNGDLGVERITRELRATFSEAISGLGISLYDIGISTSNNYKDRGKLVINETRLDLALKDRPNEVIQLFTKKSSTLYTDVANRGTRYSENGIASRIYDILQDNIRITRDSGGEKGYLIEKAGNLTGVDASSDFANKIKDMNKKIERLLVMLGEKEETYYNQFARMEAALSRLNDQSTMLASQLGG